MTTEGTTKGRVLVIDDEVLIGRSIQRALGRNYDVVLADGGARALEMMKADTKFDCVLCDLQMPDVSGMGVFEWAQENAPALIARFVFMTGGAFSEKAREFIEKTTAERMEKPFDTQVLRATVERICAKSR